MKNPKEIRYVVNVRLGSKRVPRKVVRPFAGTSLIDILLNKIVSSDFIQLSQFYFCVYDPELIEIGHRYGVNVFVRSEASVNSEGDVLTEMWDYWDKIGGEYIVKINSCAPFLPLSTIEAFARHYIETESEGLFGVVPKKDYFWDTNKNLLTPLWNNIFNTKEAPVTYMAGHVLYASRLDIIADGYYMGRFENENDPELYELREEEALDVDYEWQFEMYEAWYKAKHGITTPMPVEYIDV